MKTQTRPCKNHRKDCLHKDCLDRLVKSNMTKEGVVCPICQEETGDLLMDRRIKDTFERHTMTPNPCEKCKEKYLKTGVLLIDPKSCSLVVLKQSAFKRIFNQPVPKSHICYVERELLEKLQPEK